MKRLFFILLIVFLSSCDKEETYNDVLPYRVVDFVVNLNNPQYIDLLIPGQSVVNNDYGVQGVLIYNFNGSYKAFDLACPHLDPLSCQKMSFDGSLFLECHCDDSRFSIYDGSPQTNGVGNWAREYHVVVIDGTNLKVTN